MRFTCTLCWNEGKENNTYQGQWGLCTKHLKEWSTVTPSGTYRPNWLIQFAKDHHRDEEKMYHLELNFTDYQEELLIESRSLGEGGNITEATKQVLSGG